MSALKILLVLLVLFYLLGRIRLGGGAEYSAEGLKVHLRVGGFRFQVFPRKKEEPSKTQERKEEKKRPPKKEEEPEVKAGGSLEFLKGFLPLACEAAGELKRRIRVDRLLLDYTAGGRDAARTAVAFGGSSAAAGMLLPFFEQNFDLKEYRIRTAMDFMAKGPVIYVYAAFSTRLGQLVSFGLRYGIKLLMVYQKQKKSKKEAI